MYLLPLRSIFLSLVLMVGFYRSASSQMYLKPFVSNVFKVTDITHCGDDRLFIAEQAGRIQVSDLEGNMASAPFLDITDKVYDVGGEQGLLGLAFHPSYVTNRSFFVNYISNTGYTVISRFTTLANNPNLADTASEEILFTVLQPYSNHNGGAMHFGPDGMLYISLGDGGAGGDPHFYGQSLQTKLGKILRINVNNPPGYTIPADNPFIGTPNADSMIWAYGLRNAWRISFDKITGDLWIADVGQNVWEEINFQPASSTGGENYGWRCYEGLAVFNLTGCQPPSGYIYPVHVYPHGPACSVTGGYVYRGALHAPWFGKYFFTDYCKGIIQSLAPNDTGGFDLETYGSFSDYSYTTFGQDRYGELYIGKVTSGVFKLADSTCAPVAYINQPDTVRNFSSVLHLTAIFSPGLSYQWYFNEEPIANAVNNVLAVSISGNYKVVVTDTNSCIETSKTIVVYINSNIGLSVMPNPAGDYCEITWTEGFEGYKTLEVYDITGRLCEAITPDADVFHYRLNTYRYSKGMYVVRMLFNGETYQVKMLKQ